MAAALAMGLAGCGDDTWKPQVEKEGTLKLADLALDVNESENVGSRAVSTDNFIVEIVQGDQSVKKYNYSQMPEIITLPVGDYTVSARNNDVQPAAFSAPYYFGSAPITIADGKVSDVAEITCRFANIRVSINYSESLKAKMADNCHVQVVAGAAGDGSGATLDFGKEETRSGYFAAIDGSVTLIATFEGTVDGNEVMLQETYKNVQAGYHYSINYATSNEKPMDDEYGTVVMDTLSGIQISFGITESESNLDLGITDEDVIDGGLVRPGTEEPEPGTEDPDPSEPADPSQSVITITSETLSFVDINTNDSIQGIVNIHADLGIAHLYVNISSDNSNFMAAVSNLLPTSFDLAYTGDYTKAFASLGFPVDEEVRDQKEVVFDITQFIPLLENFPGTHTFKLEVVDVADESKSVNIKFSI